VRNGPLAKRWWVLEGQFMPHQDDKRFYRKLKKDVKRRGTKRVRQSLKQNLAENPTEAHLDEIDYGKSSSRPLNGMDADATRTRDDDGSTATGE